MPFHIRTPAPKNNSSPTRRPCSAYYKVGGTILDAFTHPFSLNDSEEKSLHLRGSAVIIQMRVSAFLSKGGPLSLSKGPFIFSRHIPRTIRRGTRRPEFDRRAPAAQNSF